MNFVERLKTFVSRPDECWNWPGLCVDGYGKVGANLDERGHRVWFAHRAAYTVLVGPVPSELELDHLCRNRRCMNPRHLEPVTPRENTLRSESPSARNARKTHCVHGHQLTPLNTVVTRTRYGTARACRACQQIAGERDRRKRGILPKVPTTACKHGHPYTPENTGTRRNGQRYCLTCHRARSREQMRRYRETPDGRASRRDSDKRYRERQRAERP